MTYGGIPLSDWSGSGATRDLHETIKQQIVVIDKQSKAIARLTVITTFLAAIQTIATVIQVLPMIHPVQEKIETPSKQEPVAPAVTPIQPQSQKKSEPVSVGVKK